MKRRALWLLSLLALCGTALLIGSASASAHPLGNFTVNHYDGLTLRPDRLDLLSVLDSAEIPTIQEKPTIDTDHDGTLSPAETRAYARQSCLALLGATTATVDGQRLNPTLATSLLEFPIGQAGLPTSRLTCTSSAPARLDRTATVSLRDDFRTERIGWREMTATGDGVKLPTSGLPAASVSNELRAYPDDLLADPLNVREATLAVEPGTGGGGAIDAAPHLGVLDSIVGSVTRTFTDLVGTKDLTPAVGLLAVLLSLVLGASHAALPGHGKTLIAAYLAGKRGSPKDAMVVGATVTVTHTAGVLLLGLLISGSSALAGESVLSWLGVLSGVLVMAIGGWLLYSALRNRRHEHVASPVAELALVGGGPAPASTGHGHGHGHAHSHGHGHGHSHGFNRGGLIGMGVAGGLVPSPSALVVLLGAVALGRTWFGVLLVFGYGFGMAATLTAVGLLLVRVRDRLDGMPRVDKLRLRIGTLGAWMPVLTAGLVLVVGLGLALRAATGNG